MDQTVHKVKLSLPGTKPLLFIVGTIFVMALFADKDTEVTSENKRKHTNITLTPKEYEELINDVKVIPWEGVIEGKDSTGNTSEERRKTYATDGSFIVSNMDPSKLSVLEVKRLREATDLISKLAQTYGIPEWYICAVSALEYSPTVLGESKVPVPFAMFDLTDLNYGDIYNGKEVNYTNFGQEEANALGVTESDRYIGPFQLDKTNSDFTGNGTVDIYNWREAGGSAAQHIQGIYNTQQKTFSGSSDDLLGGITFAVYNAGGGNFAKEIPEAAREDFINALSQIYAKEDQMIQVGQMVCSKGMSSVNNIIWDMANVPGVHMSGSAVSNATSYNSSFSPIESTFSDSLFAGRFKADGAKISNGTTGSTDEYVIGGEQLRYMIGAYASGMTMWNSMNKALAEVDKNSSSVSGGHVGLHYYWKEKQVGSSLVKSPVSLEQEVVDSKGYKVTGQFGEVGYKGQFPIFVQGSGMNDISAIPWKFNGKSTTLGASGCSLFAFMSLVHGVGYGNLPIPNQELDIDGLNEEGYICFEEMAKVLSNGPILADDVSKLGYQTKSIPTDKEGLEQIYKHLEEGIPFIVNVRYGDVTGYDIYGDKHNVHFTNSGHFIVLSSAYRKGNKRFVEVIQSTYSKAGTISSDENALSFDYDELIEKGIIKSSAGYEVPAYTIIGRTDQLKEPNYANSYYKPNGVNSELEEGYLSTISNTDEQPKASISGLVADMTDTGYILLPTDMYIDINKGFVDLYVTSNSFLRVTNVNYYVDIKESDTYKKGTYVGLIAEDSTFTRYVVDSEGQIEKIEVK